ncbi:flagellar hook protein FlgE [Acidithiobacillus thiooxidans]|uniref:Flagellar hook protein FlgE n=1 Tax=Acidithiobacillus thiooxidans ATCC 19377 TaxID=637390 RepID=A0A543Q7T6_ACITH|nr:flagellar hook protein FlgE [Acidithiobacillus thiooxidans]MDX5936122.1 flagellar hook protein FlgE [Acidithiobacillus thiooxidans]TQN52373.1 Flagellar hook protein FlgE [Acidithiobacillus thiooxidans ATCC 19377]
MGAFNTALSGLQAANTDLQTLGNNISNANTVGFKSSNAEFADAYASAMANTAPTDGQVGIGTTVQTIAQQFTQGNIETTSNPLDVAINGNGFFQFNYNGSTVYGRNGQFQLNKNGVIVDANGGELIGIQAQNGQLTGASGPLSINQNAIAPQATSGLSLGLNLDSTNTPISGTINMNDPSTYNYSTTTTVYDSLGTPQLLTTYYQLQSGSGTTISGQTWDVDYSVTGTNGASGVTSGSLGTLQFNNLGQETGSTSTSISGISWADGAASNTINVSFSGSTNYNSPNSVVTNNSNGYSAGQLSGLSIDSGGNIFGTYSNGESQLMGQISLTRFPDNNGLQNLGNNYWAETYVSGQPLSGQPGSSNLGVLQAGAVEQSNVDISTDLVNLIVAQQAYQANAQTIKTQNTVVQTLLSL